MQELLAQILEQAPEAILFADREGVIRYWNRGAEALFGYPSASAVGQSLDLIIPEPLRGRHWDGYRRVMASGVTKYQTGLLTSPGVCHDGRRVSLEFSMVLVRDAAGGMLGCAAIMRDVSERWQREKELKAQLFACQEQLSHPV